MQSKTGFPNSHQLKSTSPLSPAWNWRRAALSCQRMLAFLFLAIYCLRWPDMHDIETLVVGAVEERLIVALPGRLTVDYAPHRPGSDDSAECTASATVVSRCRSIVPDKFIRVDCIWVACGSTMRMEPWPPSGMLDTWLSCTPKSDLAACCMLMCKLHRTTTHKSVSSMTKRMIIIFKHYWTSTINCSNKTMSEKEMSLKIAVLTTVSTSISNKEQPSSLLKLIVIQDRMFRQFRILTYIRRTAGRTA